MKDWVLMFASAATASLIAYGELSAGPREFPAEGRLTAAVPEEAVVNRDPEAVAANGANDQAIGAMGQAGRLHDR